MTPAPNTSDDIEPVQSSASSGQPAQDTRALANGSDYGDGGQLYMSQNAAQRDQVTDHARAPSGYPPLLASLYSKPLRAQFGNPLANRLSCSPYPHQHASRQIRWVKGDIIGSGASGRVFMGLDEDTGGLIAVKEIQFSPEDKDELAKMQSEVREG